MCSSCSFLLCRNLRVELEIRSSALRQPCPSHRHFCFSFSPFPLANVLNAYRTLQSSSRCPATAKIRFRSVRDNVQSQANDVALRCVGDALLLVVAGNFVVGQSRSISTSNTIVAGVEADAVRWREACCVVCGRGCGRRCLGGSRLWCSRPPVRGGRGGAGKFD